MIIAVNKDKELVKEIRKKLKENDNFCPCRLLKNPNNKCMCKEFRDQIERKEAGLCHCCLYEIIIDEKE